MESWPPDFLCREGHQKLLQFGALHPSFSDEQQSRLCPYLLCSIQIYQIFIINSHLVFTFLVSVHFLFFLLSQYSRCLIALPVFDAGCLSETTIMHISRRASLKACFSFNNAVTHHSGFFSTISLFLFVLWRTTRGLHLHPVRREVGGVMFLHSKRCFATLWGSWEKLKLKLE